MDDAFPIIVSVVTVYAVVCGSFGADSGAPLWLRWPLPIWNFIAHDWRRSRSHPNHAKIERLERELGIGTPRQEADS
ncbi:hypothetical protein [Streptomyces noursei]|uniref:hypothetical protein n=1 Tax=Streptomyces noursei TaxID=1971 RepID=UPI001678490A|nr:hypothetical protein [Streptomyces noursei]MCZ1013922.1 hypothetical protein [Streptomyces noursei]GGX40852.1 hypothetical protein GCM10010341_73530 [Streptomyces noursei]